MKRVSSWAFGATAWTMATNLAIVGITLLASILVARALGPQGRGQFATLMAVFTIAMVIGELGQSASVTYHASLPRADYRSVIVTGRRIMVLATAATVITAMGVVLLTLDDRLIVATYVVVLAGCFANALAAPYLYATQALYPSTWNRVRLTQPVVYVSLVAGAFSFGRLTLLNLGIALVASTAATLAVGTVAARRMELAGGRFERPLSGQMLRYGALAASAGVPISLGQNLDKLVLAGVASSALVGQYAVATSVAAMSQPFASAISSVAFPLVASEESEEGRRRLGRQAVRRTVLVTLPLTFALAAGGMWLIPLVFGQGFAPATMLLWVLLPGQFVRSLNLVLTGLLRGVGDPGAAARCQIVAAVAFLVTLVPAVALLGNLGIGVALLVGECLALLVGSSAWAASLERRQLRAAE